MNKIGFIATMLLIYTGALIIYALMIFWALRLIGVPGNIAAVIAMTVSAGLVTHIIWKNPWPDEEGRK